MVKEPLQRLFSNRGVKCGSIGFILLNPLRMEDELEKIFEQNKASKESLLIILIDRSETKSHEFLKLMERTYMIPTQHLTTELAKKFQR
ncbi:hypothetical protein COOONC_02871 [Cooperia oncophora]